MKTKTKSCSIVLALTTIVLFLILISSTASAESVQSSSTGEAYAYITNYDSNTISVVNVTTNTVTATVNVGIKPSGVAINSIGTKVYVTNYGSNTVSVIDTYTNTVTATVNVGLNPYGITITPDGTKVYVTNYHGNTVSVIDAVTNNVTATVNVGLNPYGVAVHDESEVYVTNYGNNTISAINTTTNTIKATLSVGAYPYGLAVSPDGKKVYVVNEGNNNVSVIDTATENVVATVKVGTYPYGIALNPTGTKAYVTNSYSNTVSVINTENNTVTATLDVGPYPVGIVINPAGTKLYVAHDHSDIFSIIDTNTNNILLNVNFGADPFALGKFIGLLPVQPAYPVANFNTNVTSGYAPLSVQFNDLSENANDWNWDFGDGVNSTDQNPTHTFSAAGNYTINLTASNGNGTSSKLGTITVLEQEQPVYPVANFNTNVTSGYAPLSVQFNDLSENANDWNWDFGDGVNSTDQNPTHTFSAAGNYTINLTASNGNGMSSKLGTITVLEQEQPVYPVANFNTNVTSGYAPLSVQFNDLSENANDWNWDFGDGVNSTDQNPTHTFSAAGNYTINLTASNGNGTSSKLGTITVLEQEQPVYPVANFNTNVTSGYAPLSVQFNDLSENANDWNWDFGDGVNSTDQNPTHTFSAAGNYTINLTASNGNGMSSKLGTITVLEQEQPVYPVANFNTNVTSGYAPLSVQFNDLSENANDWNWDFGDGVNSTDQNPTHTFSAAGNYTINLTASNGNGTSSKLGTITVLEQEQPVYPVANFNTNVTSGYAPLSVQFNDLSENANDWNWDFGDGVNSTDQNPTHTFSAAGNYTINLTASNGNGTSSKLGTITVLEQEQPVYPVANFNTNVTSGYAPLSVQFNDLSENANDWNWDFGDGVNSTDQNPTHTFSAAGNYTINLTASNGNGMSSKLGTITVLEQEQPVYPVANFNTNVTSGYAPLSVQFNDLSENANDWNWDFGDGVNSTDQNPTHTFSAAGNYTINLTASNGNGTSSKLGTITVLEQEQPVYPVANFNTNVTSGYAPLSVQFNDLSENANDWNWDFGDGVNSTDQNPTHTFSAAGNYTINLTASNGNGTSSKLGTITVLEQEQPVYPVANFNTNVTSGYAPLSVQFNDLSENANDWNWDFGDGVNSTDQNPTHTFSAAGNYTINLTASNGNGTSSKLGTITVLEQEQPVYPVANFNTNVTSGYAPLSVQFNDLSENANDWNWDFGDGVNSTDQNPTHTFSAAGNYTINLTASNGNGTSSKLGTITVLEQEQPVYPVANFNTNVTSGYAPLSVQFNDLSENANDWNWDFGDGVNSTDQNPTHTFSAAGNYTINLTASNGNGMSSKLGTITVLEQEQPVYPVANFNTNVTSGYAPLSVQFNDLSENANDWNWDFGDGVNSTDQNPTHTFSAAGNYTINLTASNGNGMSSKLGTITVLEQEQPVYPVANFNTNVTSGYAPLSVQFNDLSENANDWNWDFGDGVNSTDQNPTHTFSAAGNYTINLTASNGNGTSSKLGTITVLEQEQPVYPVANFNTNVTSGYAPLSVQFNDLSENANDWNWDFGDGVNSTDQNPTHTFSAAGNYTINLTASNGNGMSSKLGTITVLEQEQPVYPVANFNTNVTSGYAPLSVQFNDLSENANDWNWDFGDGVNSTDQNPTHTFSAAGNYTINLTASNGNGTSSKLGTITVLEQEQPVYPVANFNTNVTSGYAPLSVQFNDLSENANDWNWDFGDGVNSTDQNPTHTFSAAGNYTINLTASNGNGTSSKLGTITVLEQEQPVYPVANFNTNVTSGYAPLSVQFNDLSENANDWNWDFGDGVNSTDQNPTHTFSAAGNYTINLTASNGNGTSSKLGTITVLEQEQPVYPVANFNTNVTSGYAPLSVQFNDLSENANDWNWDFGDGVNSTDQNPTHTFSAAGNYTINLTASNGNGMSSKLGTITVLEQEQPVYPVANFNTNVTSGYAPLSVQFNDLSENANDWNWDFGDGVNSTDQNPTHTFSAAGNYTINLTASNGNGTSSKLGTITVLEQEQPVYPVANFNTNVTSGYAPLSVQFNDLSENANDWNWDFGDGVNSTDQNPTHTFSAAGNYTINLTASNGNGMSSKLGTITVLEQEQPVYPVANFNTNVTSGYAPLSVQFNDLSENANDWNWDFGDGVNSTDQNPTHTFSAAGNYTINLTASNGNGTSSKLGTITVLEQEQPVYPVANFNTNVTSGYAPLSVQFNDLSENANDWNWDFGDGVNSTDQNPTHTFSAAGNYTINLTASNGNGMSSKLGTITVLEQEQPVYPVANFNTNVTSGYAPLSVQFNDLSENANDWNWDFGDGVNSTDQNPTHTFSAAGNYTINLTASNGNGMSSKLGTITVLEQEQPVYPVANFNTNVTSGYAPLSVQFNDLSENANDWNWDFGDGVNSTDQNPTHTFSAAGNYTINLTASNGNGMSSKLGTITVLEQEQPVYPVANFNTNVTSGYAPLSVQFNDLSENANDWNWDFGDGVNSTDQNPTHTFSAAGNYTINLTASNGNGTSSKLGTITVLEQEQPVYPVANFNTNVTSGYAPLSVQFNDLSENANDWNWDFGDGVNSTDQNPTHTFSAAGNYTINLTASNGNGMSSKLGTITVLEQEQPVYPVANFNTNVTSGYAPLSVQFNDLSENANDWNWDFGDGVNSTDQNPTHTFSAAGNYTINLTASNGNGTSSKLGTITVLEQEQPVYPVANFNTNVTSGYAPLSVQFNDLSENANDWNWDFGDGVNSTDQNPTHTFSAAGNYTINLTASNGNGMSSKLGTITVLEQEQPVYPVANFNTNVTSGYAPLSVQFNDLSENANDWNWDFGDGVNSTDQNPTHTFSVAGNYTINLTASNGNGTSSKLGTITVLEQEQPVYPVANFNTNVTSGYAPLSVQFNDLSENANDWNWDFGDGVNSTNQNPTHTFSAAGNYTINLTASNGNGMSSKLGTITVLEQEQPVYPVANFNTNVTSGYAPLSVQFNDLSENANDWNWDFGDGVNSTDQNPTHTFSVAGNYTINLTTSNGNGTSSKLGTITVSNDAPVAAFSASQTTGNAPLNVSFTDQSTGSPTSWEWLFGDGTNATQQNPVHIYSEAGKYTVSLKVNNSGGSSSVTKASYITVSNGVNAPVAVFSASQTTGNAPLNVSFTDQSTGSPTSWEWLFGDGTNATQQNPVHIYSEAGKYAVSLKVNNSIGSSSVTKARYITVSNGVNAPVAVFSASQTTGNAPLNVSFTDQSTGSPTSWEWLFGDGTNATQQNPVHVYSEVGKYTVSLKVNNPGGSSSVTKASYITVSNTVPVAAFSASQTTGNAPLNVSFTDQSTGSPTSWEWLFGDGTNATQQNPVHIYSEAGKYTVSLKVNNPGGSSSVTKASYITVSNAAPVAAFSASQTTGNAPLNVSFTDQSIGSPTSWEWLFGDGTNATQQNPVHVYSEAGKYTVSLKINNPGGSSSVTKASYITVSNDVNAPVAAFSASQTTGNAPLNVSFTDQSTESPTSWEWLFGDGTNATQQNPVHIYSEAGKYTVSLKVNNPGGSSTKTIYGCITVKK
jgi:YVTN family beta-propeller protein